MQALIAVLAGWGVPFVCTETQELGGETVASYLYQIHLYHWLESNGYRRWLADDVQVDFRVVLESALTRS
jgi:hypothetical protein